MLEDVYKILIGLVSSIYKIAGLVYQVFFVIAEHDIFSNDMYQSFLTKVYLILGVVLSFIIAYNILNMVIDPDKNKGGKEVEKLFKKIISSFVLILVMPSIFIFASQVQTSILSTNGGVIEKFFSNAQGYEQDTVKHYGNTLASTTFSAFFEVTDKEILETEDLNDVICGENNYHGDQDPKMIRSQLPYADKVEEYGSCSFLTAQRIAEIDNDYSMFQGFAKNIADDEIDFHWFVALIAGGFLVYVLVSFCFDIAVRACKLVLYEMIAPFCIACRILPKQEDIFKKWLKKTWSTYLELFIRIFIMCLGVYLISVFLTGEFFEANMEGGFWIKKASDVFIILGLITFIKQAPKLIDEIFGLGKDIKWGIKNKLKDSGAFVTGAAIGSMGTSAVQNTIRRRAELNKLRAMKDNGLFIGDEKEKEYKKRVRMAKLANSTLLGGASGLIRGANQGMSAKDWKTMRSAAAKGAQNQASAADKHMNYIADHGGTIGGAIMGHVGDIKNSISDWAKGKDLPTLERQSAALGKFTSTMSRNKKDAEGIISSEMSKGKNSKLSFNDLKTKWSAAASAEEKQKYETYVKEVLNLTGHSLNSSFDIVDGTGAVVNDTGTIFGLQNDYIAKQRELERIQAAFANGGITDPNIVQEARDAVSKASKELTDKLQSASFSDSFMEDKSDMFVDTFKDVGLSGKETVAAGISIAGTESAIKGSTLESLEKLKNGQGTMKDFKNGAESMKDSASADKARIDNEIALRKKDEAAKGDKK